MRKGIMALEGIEEAVNAQAPAPELINADVVKIDANIGDIIDKAEKLEEGETVVESIDKVIGTVERSVEAGEGLDQTSAELANTALEQFYNRLSYVPRPGRETVALEGISEPASRLENSKALLSGLKKFRTRLSAAMKIAAEELAEAIGEQIEDSGEKVENILSYCQRVSGEFDDKGAASEPIAAGAWSEAFGGFAGNPSAADIVARVVAVSELLKNGELVAYVNGKSPKKDDSAAEAPAAEDKPAERGVAQEGLEGGAARREDKPAAEEPASEPAATETPAEETPATDPSNADPESSTGEAAAAAENPAGDKDVLSDVKAALSPNGDEKAIEGDIPALSADEKTQLAEAVGVIGAELVAAADAFKAAGDTEGGTLQDYVETSAALMKLCYSANELIEKSAAGAAA